jgi:iron complex transport system ATP-binding protein
MSGLRAEGVTVRRGGCVILDAVSLAFRAGEFVAVCGPNGAGKSTLLSVLSGLLRPDAGKVMLGGKEFRDYSARELARRRAYLPQNPRCEWPISVERLVGLGLTPVLPAFGPLPRGMGERIDTALKSCGLWEQRGRAATSLSGGELARAMLARALVGDPDVLIADEPVSGLDPRHALDAAARLRAMAEAGKMVIASIHDLTLAARYATRMVVLHHGRAAACGKPEEILTPELLGGVFDVRARLAQGEAGPYVDFGGIGGERAG